MKTTGFWRVGLVACAAAIAVQGCGSGGSGNDGHVRLINATVNHSGLDLYDGTNKVESGVAVGSASGYADISSGSPVLSVDDTGSTTAIASFTPTLSNSTHYAVLSYESNGGVYFSIINEEVTAPDSGSAQLAVRNFTYDAGSLDIYLTATTATTVPTTAPNYVSAAPASLGSQAATVGGSVTPNTSYSVWVTAHGSKTDVRLVIPSITIADKSVNSIVLTPAVGGVLVNGALLVQQGAYTPFANTAARVKLVNGATSDGSHMVNLSASTLTTGVLDTSAVTGSTGAYINVPNAASATLTATYANGPVTVSPAGATLSPGADYTVLVSGGGAVGYTAAVLTDDNHLPLVQGNAKLRLVNGFANAGALSVVVDSATPANNVGIATASSYTEVAGDPAAQINVTAQLAVAAGTTGNICQSQLYPTSSSTVRLTGLTTNSSSGGVYSLYILGDNTTINTTTGTTTTSAPTSFACQLRLER